MSRHKIKIKIIENLQWKSHSIFLMNFDVNGQPKTNAAAEWLEATIEAVESMVSYGMDTYVAVNHVRRIVLLSRDLK